MEIPYGFNVLKWKDAPWKPVGFKIADAMATYWTNCAKTGDPNDSGLPHCPRYDSADKYQVMILGPETHACSAEHQKRFEFLDSFVARYRAKDD